MKVIVTTTRGRYARFDDVEEISSPIKLGATETKQYTISLKNGNKHHFPERVVEEIEVKK